MKKYNFFLAVVLLLFSGCAKEGTDGEATLVVMPRHHGGQCFSLGSYNDSVYIKFGVKDVPEDPTHDYDVVFVGDSGEDHVHCENMKWGSYSVYCTCWDTSMNMRVYGGVVTKIKHGARKDEIDLVVPVAEN